MRRKSLVIAAGIAASLAAATWNYGPSAVAQPYGGGWGLMGGGYRSGGGWGFRCPWFDGNGPGWARGGPGWSGASNDLKLTTDDVKTQVERWLAWRGNPRLKVGDIREKDADTIVADVVTKDNSLVQRFNVNRHTGYYERDGE